MTNRHFLSPFFLDQPLPALEALREPGWVECRPELPAGDQKTRMSALHRGLADRVAETLARGERPVIIAGDCCASIPMAAGFERAGIEPLVIWLDAHGDFNTPATSPSGFVGGMPLAMIVGRGDLTLTQALGLTPWAEQNVILTDARDLDPGEREAVASSKVHHLRTTAALLDHPLPERPIWVHFDADVVDPSESPAHSYRAPGGPSVATLEKVLARIAATGRLAAVSLSSWNTELDTDGTSRRVTMALLERLTGSG